MANVNDVSIWSDAKIDHSFTPKDSTSVASFVKCGRGYDTTQLDDDTVLRCVACIASWRRALGHSSGIYFVVVEGVGVELYIIEVQFKHSLLVSMIKLNHSLVQKASQLGAYICCRFPLWSSCGLIARQFQQYDFKRVPLIPLRNRTGPCQTKGNGISFRTVICCYNVRDMKKYWLGQVLQPPSYLSNSALKLDAPEDVLENIASAKKA